MNPTPSTTAPFLLKSLSCSYISFRLGCSVVSLRHNRFRPAPARQDSISSGRADQDVRERRPASVGADRVRVQLSLILAIGELMADRSSANLLVIDRAPRLSN
jgi:hypothetical protein